MGRINKVFNVIVLSFLMIMLFAGCIKDDNATVLLPLPIGDIEGVDVPAGLLDYIHINEGVNPPDIKGCYMADSVTIEYASDDYWNDEFYGLFMKFASVEGRNITKYNERQKNSAAEATLARVIGSGNNFTVYFVMDMSDDIEHWTCKTLTIISGTLQSDGIANFQYANAMLEKNDPYNKIMEVGEYHVFNNRGGVVALHEW